MIKCPISGSANVRVIYTQRQVPYIQNLVYDTAGKAQNSPCVDVVLAQSLETNFVFSAYSGDSVIDYDAHYQNEQSNSLFFQQHLQHVINLMESRGLLSGKIVEVGCGKGFFLDMLVAKGLDVTGFDPTYEGNSPRVIKDFFSDRYSDIGAEFIVLRHTLEHIISPLQFLKDIAKANNHKGRIYIEVPTFEWIMNNNAVEDIFHEHCNYFTLQTLQMLFSKSEGGHIFEGQYIYVIADLADVVDQVASQPVTEYHPAFEAKTDEYSQRLGQLGDVAIWGAGAKGSTYLNLVDKNREKVRCVIDINPMKQHRYLGGTGHYIISPDEIEEYNIRNVVIMNTNYSHEIVAGYGHLPVVFKTLEQD